VPDVGLAHTVALGPGNELPGAGGPLLDWTGDGALAPDSLSRLRRIGGALERSIRRPPTIAAPSTGGFEATRRVLSASIPGLDGVRGVAILFVLFHHFGLNYPTGTRVDSAIAGLFGFMWCGVDLFFVLSGFLITGILIESRGAANYFTAFYMRRVLRIFPLFYLFLAVWFGLAPVLFPRLGLRTDQQLWYLFYLANWIPLDKQSHFLSHLWSLAVEEQFYFVWPLVMWALPTKWLGRACLLAAALAVAVRAGLAVTGASPTLAYEITPARMDSLAIGGLCAVALRSPRGHELFRRLWRPVLLVSLVALVVELALAGSTSTDPLATRTVGFSLLAVASACLVTGTVLNSGGSSIWQRLIESRWLRVFGKYSYAIYLLHFPLVIAVFHSQRLASWQWPRSRHIEFIVTGIAVSLALAMLSWQFVEKPCLRLKSYFSVVRGAVREGVAE
jgi:peptidoglycan/LPS O-acetylase OafA/YrhL